MKINPEQLVNIRIPLIVGALIRRGVRRDLKNLKERLTWNFPDCTVDLFEDKGVLDSEFILRVQNIPFYAAELLEKIIRDCVEGV